MKTVDIIISCTDSIGFNWLPVKMESLNTAAILAHHTHRRLFNDDKELLLIEQVKTHENKTWVYYQYLLYGIYDASCRRGSFFGLTVVSDTLCSNANLILDLCRRAFNKYVVGTILQPKGGTYIVCATLSTQESVRKAIVSFFAKILAAYQDSGILEDVPTLTSPLQYQPVSLNNEKQVLCRLNPDDATPSKIIEQIKAGRKVAVSDNYPTLLQQRLVYENTRIAGQLDTCKNELVDAKASLDNANKKASDALLEKNKLQCEVSNLKDEHNRNSKKLHDEIERMKREQEAEISKYKAQGNYPMQVQIDTIISMLHKTFVSFENTQKTSQHNIIRNLNRLLIIAVGTAVIVIGLFLFLVQFIYKTNDNNTKNQIIQEQFTKDSISENKTTPLIKANPSNKQSTSTKNDLQEVDKSDKFQNDKNNSNVNHSGRPKTRSPESDDEKPYNNSNKLQKTTNETYNKQKPNNEKTQ